MSRKNLSLLFACLKFKIAFPGGEKKPRGVYQQTSLRLEQATCQRSNLTPFSFLNVPKHLVSKFDSPFSLNVPFSGYRKMNKKKIQVSNQELI